MALAVHFEGAGRTQQRRPLDVVERRAYVLHRAEQDEVFHVEDARSLVGAFQGAAQAGEVPRLAVGHGGGGLAGEEMTGVLDLAEELLQQTERLWVLRRGVDHQVEFVQLEPHLGGDDLPDGAGVFARGAEAGEDGVRVHRIEGEELNHVWLRGRAAAFGEILMVTGDVDQRLPLLVLAVGGVEHELKIDFDEPGHVLSPLDIPAHPVDGISDSAEHGSLDDGQGVFQTAAEPLQLSRVQDFPSLGVRELEGVACHIVVGLDVCLGDVHAVVGEGLDDVIEQAQPVGGFHA